MIVPDISFLSGSRHLIDIGGLGDQKCSAVAKGLRALLQEFERNAAEPGAPTIGFVCDEL
jgi:hypothetical protein